MQPNENEKESRYFVYNYMSLRESNHVEFEAWKSAVLEQCNGMTIIAWRSYRTPLKTLGPVGKYLMQALSASPFLFFAFVFAVIFLFISISTLSLFSAFASAWVVAYAYQHIDHAYRLEHSFIVFKLIRSSDIAYASFEKIRNGMLFQFAPSLETARDYALGESRGHVELVQSSDQLGFEGILSKNITSMQLILQSEEIFGAYYNVFFDNCQQTVAKLQACLAEKSLDLKFQIPGSEESISINDDRAIDFVEKLNPRWAQNHVQEFPPMPEPFAILI